MSETPAPPLPEGLVAIVKRDCPTCVLVAPVLEDLASRADLTVITQDDPDFPADASWVIHDHDLALSWHHDIETVPTLLRVRDGELADSTVGWSREHWEALTGIDDLGPDLPDMRPGCGSLSVDPTRTDELSVRFSGSTLTSRRVEIAALEDEWEALMDRGWSDGMPVVPPTEARVLRMLEGTSRAASDIVAIVPPDLVECTVEKVAINAVMAGCKPEYLPVVLTALEVACTDEFNMHGLLATTMPVGPIRIVNGPIRNEIGMNSGLNLLGQGNRANSTIGRAMQLIIRNVAVDGSRLEVDHGPLWPQVVERSPLALAFRHDRLGGDLRPARGQRADSLPVGDRRDRAPHLLAPSLRLRTVPSTAARIPAASSHASRCPLGPEAAMEYDRATVGRRHGSYVAILSATGLNTATIITRRNVHVIVQIPQLRGGKADCERPSGRP